MWLLDPLLGNDSVNIFPREPKRATIGRLLLGNGSVNTPKTTGDNRGRFPWSPLRGYITRISKGAVSCNRVEFRDVSLPGYELGSRGNELSRVFGTGSYKTMIRKWVRRRKEDSMCDLKLQWDCDKSFARIRLVKAENPSACATVNCNVCRSAIALYVL
jgi:hypothetical protein